MLSLSASTSEFLLVSTKSLHALTQVRERGETSGKDAASYNVFTPLVCFGLIATSLEPYLTSVLTGTTSRPASPRADSNSWEPELCVDRDRLLACIMKVGVRRGAAASC